MPWPGVTRRGPRQQRLKKYRGVYGGRVRQHDPAGRVGFGRHLRLERFSLFPAGSLEPISRDDRDGSRCPIG